MEEAQQIDITKDKSPNITNSTYPKSTVCRLLTYKENMDIQDEASDPMFTVVIAENERQWREGVARLSIKVGATELRALVNMDVLISVFRREYAREINDLELRALRRERMIRFKKNLRYYWQEVKHFVHAKFNQ